MNAKEIAVIIAAILILSVSAGLGFMLRGTIEQVVLVFIFSAIIILVNIFVKKIIARSLDADIEHEIWYFSQFGFKAHQHTKKPIPLGIIVPLVAAVATLGFLKLPAIITYEARALRVRAARRFGNYSYTEMTDWHNAIIGASGIIALLLLALITYLLPVQGFELLAQLASYYAFVNMIPFSKLDGTQIFFGSRVLYFTLGIITVIFTAYSLLIGSGLI